MTHEYVIAMGGIVLPPGPRADPAPTAIAWAANRVLAVGSDEVVRSISRGDSTFLWLDSCAVTFLPSDVDTATILLRGLVAAGGGGLRVTDALVESGLLDPTAGLEPGTPADLAFWSADPERLPSAEAGSLHLVATVRAGAFTTGDVHLGPFGRVDAA